MSWKDHCFQESGKCPYFGQASWFVHFYTEQLRSAIERNQNEVRHVTKVFGFTRARLSNLSSALSLSAVQSRRGEVPL